MNLDSLQDQVDNLPEEIPKGGDIPGKDVGDTPADRKDDSGTPKPAKSDGEGEIGPEGGPKGDAGGDPGAKTDPAANSEPKSDDSEGYIADEGGEEADEASPKEDKAGEPSGLSPDLQYVVDNLPTLYVRGKTSADGAVKTFQVKAAGQLPEDFEFATKRDELLFTQALAGQELKAQQLQSKYYQDQQSKAANDFSERENRDIRKDIGDLQREGKLARFKLQPNDAKFNDDPAVKQAQEVIDYMNEVNGKYLEAANKGGVLYHLSFRDAYRLMQQDAPPKAETKQAKEDKERKDVTRKGAGSASSAPSGGAKVPGYAFAGDLKDMVDLMDI